MSEQESVWYYTQHGERKGPVTIEVLRGAIEHLKVDREKDLIWGPGLSDWVTMDKVPELRDLPAGPPPVTPPKEQEPEGAVPPPPPAGGIGSAPSPAAQPAPVSNPYQAPKAAEEDNALSDALAARRASEGSKGMGRVAYLVWHFLIYAGMIGAFVALVFAVPQAGPVDQSVLGGIGIALIIGLVVVTIVSILVTLSRLKNLSMSGWNFFWSFVPFVNIWLYYRLVACPAGYADHKQLDTPGQVMRVLFIVYILFCFILPFLFSFASVYKEAADEAARQIQEENRAKQEAAE